MDRITVVKSTGYIFKESGLDLALPSAVQSWTSDFSKPIFSFVKWG